MVITPYFPLTFSEQIGAHSCQVKVTTQETYKGYWGTKSLLDHSTEFRKLDLEQCTTEVNKIRAHTTTMTEIGHGIFTNDLSPVTDEYYWCCKDHIIHRYRFIIKQFTISFNFHNKKIIYLDSRQKCVHYLTNTVITSCCYHCVGEKYHRDLPSKSRFSSSSETHTRQGNSYLDHVIRRRTNGCIWRLQTLVNGVDICCTLQN